MEKIQNEIVEEISKYKKKKKSDTSNATKKSNHKHDYKPCLIKYKYKFNSEFINIVSYCTICGKIGKNLDKNRSQIDRCNDGQIHLLKNNEIIERNSDIPLFELDDFSKDCVDLNAL